MSFIRSKRLFSATICFLLSFFLCSCANPSAKAMQTATLFAMDTVMELQIMGDETLLTNAEEMIRNLEKKLSVTDPQSEIAVLNSTGKNTLSEDTFSLTQNALSLCRRTDGALDITIYPVLKAWGFTTGQYRVPTQEEIDLLIKNVDFSQVELDEESKACSIPENMQLDLGSVAKGYTSRTIASYFTENGVKSGLINLGGNVQCIGSKPGGTPWKIAIKSPYPDSQSGIYGVLEATDTAIITSGGYERYFEENGETYWHIIDPKTGKPSHNDLLSVTIVGNDGLLCDALSTALFVKGLEGAIDEYKNSNDFDMILITTKGDVYITQGIRDNFLLSSEYYNASIHTIEK